MSEHLWVALILVASWASLPASIVIATSMFDKDVVKEGEDAHHHH